MSTTDQHQPGTLVALLAVTDDEDVREPEIVTFEGQDMTRVTIGTVAADSGTTVEETRASHVRLMAAGMLRLLARDDVHRTTFFALILPGEVTPS